jgi:hypothetical protein
VNGSRKFFLKIFGSCPNITVKHKRVSKQKYPSQLVTSVPWKIPLNGRNPTQKTEHVSEPKRPKHAQNKISRPEKLIRQSPRNLASNTEKEIGWRGCSPALLLETKLATS